MSSNFDLLDFFFSFNSVYLEGGSDSLEMIFFDPWLFRRLLFDYQALEIFPSMFCHWFLVLFHCGSRTQFIWFQFFYICWGLFNGSGYPGECSMDTQKIHILFLLGGVLYKCQLDPLGWSYSWAFLCAWWFFCLVVYRLLREKC